MVHRPLSLTPRERAAEQNPSRGALLRGGPAGAGVRRLRQPAAPLGRSGPGLPMAENEHGIFVDDNDFIWLAGNGKKDGQLLKFTMDGKFVLQIGRRGRQRQQRHRPARLACRRGGRYRGEGGVRADGYANRRVAVFDAETGAYKRHWGAYGNKPSDEKTPRYDPAETAVTAVRQSGALHPPRQGRADLCVRPHQQPAAGFRKDGTFVSEHIYEKNTRGNGTVYDLVFSPDAAQKLIYMIDGMNGEVRVVDRASKEVVTRFGRPGRQAGQFTALHNIAVDRQGNVYTAEVNTGQRVQKFRRIDAQSQ
jgi:hypothetical protein